MVSRGVGPRPCVRLEPVFPEDYRSVGRSVDAVSLSLEFPEHEGAEIWSHSCSSVSSQTVSNGNDHFTPGVYHTAPRGAAAAAARAH